MADFPGWPGGWGGHKPRHGGDLPGPGLRERAPPEPLSLFHAWLYARLSGSWPPGLWLRTWRLGGLVFVLSYVFFEFFTPFNLFWEPLPLLALELGFWAVVALAEALAIVGVMPSRSP